MRERASRVTAAGLATLGVLADAPHDDDDAAAASLRVDLGTVSTQAVYDEVMYWGTCSRCRSTASPITDPTPFPNPTSQEPPR